jgi:CubicO group peptidase (beta-lactamase class C family)
MALVLCLAFSFFYGCGEGVVDTGRAYTAHQLCAYVFSSQIDEDYALDSYIAPRVSPLDRFWQVDVDYNEQSVVCGTGFPGSAEVAKAVYREGLGCTLLVDRAEDEVLSQQFSPIEPPQLPDNQPWPYGTAGVFPDPISGLNMTALHAAVDKAFEEPAEGEPKKYTAAALAAYKGKLIIEKYGQGLTPDTPWLAWSMSKSITGTLIGLLRDRGLISIDDSAPIAEWEGTPKASITTRHLLHMASGLAWTENYTGIGPSTVTRMFYLESDQAAYAASRPRILPPGEEFEYNTGNTALLAKIVQDSVGGTLQDSYNFYRTQLFHKIDVTSAFFQPDASGLIVGGKDCFMTPRDWARVGQLYLQRGEWDGEQVVSEEWIDFATSPSPASDGYGAQIWLHGDRYSFRGHRGQYVYVVPSEDLVVVRMGASEGESGIDELVDGIIAALP